jgi:predicted RNA-binding protein YlxR (DUF448 family)
VDGDADLERTCIVTRATREPASLIRFVRAPDGGVAPDLKRKLPGRGAWITARADIVAKATAKTFSRAFRAETRPAADLADLVERLLRRDALQSLSLANKAGAVIAGFDRISDQLAAGRVAALLHAQEAAEGGRIKLARAARGRVETLAPFETAEMDLALGRIHVIHAALAAGAVSEACLLRCRLLLAYRGAGGDDMPAGEAGADDHIQDTEEAAGRSAAADPKAARSGTE